MSPSSSRPAAGYSHEDIASADHQVSLAVGKPDETRLKRLAADAAAAFDRDKPTGRSGLAGRLTEPAALQRSTVNASPGG